MKMTTKGRYALRAVLALCMDDTDKPVSIKKLAEQESISQEFLEQIFYRLRQSGIVTAVRGPGGGFKLAKAPAKITLGDLLEAAGESIEIGPCSGCNPCENDADCLSRIVWNDFQDHIDKFVFSRTLHDMTQKAKRKK